ncbi:MAG: tetratricopeptide repeat protein [Ardenticatenaceae bacterium]|nr:tetratricopeptide repeat protein [Ardenticatenaceae bacterium]
MGEYDTAVSYYEQALVIDQAIGSKAGEATNLGNLGNVYYSWGSTTLPFPTMNRR